MYKKRIYNIILMTALTFFKLPDVITHCLYEAKNYCINLYALNVFFSLGVVMVIDWLVKDKL